jgi:hypothetical protein
MLIVPVVVAIVLFYENEPPPVPSPDRNDTVDCLSLSATQLQGTNSRINITVSVGDFVEFPRATALRMLRVVVRNGEIVTEYPFHNFLYVSLDGSNISFCIFHPMSGVVRTSLFCYNRLVAESEHISTNLDSYPDGWSRCYASPHRVVRMTEFCFGDGVIHYYAQGMVHMTSLRVATGYDVPVEVHRHSVAHDLSDFSVHRKPVLFVSASPHKLWRQLTDVLVPIWGSTFLFQSVPEVRVLLMRNQMWMVKNIGQMVPGKILLNDTRGCFADGDFLRAPGGVAIDDFTNTYRQSPIVALVEQLLWMITIRVDVMAGFRAVFTNRSLVPELILVDRISETLIPRIRKEYPTLSVAKLPETEDMTVVADVVASANVFIASHLSTFVFSVFLSPKATLVEIQPKGMECTAFGERWAHLSGAHYVPLRVAPECDCPYSNLTCYMTAEPTWSRITDTELKRALEIAFHESLKKE